MLRLASRVVLMQNGLVVDDGPPSEVLATAPAVAS
jgi:ABC-type proline/glycine betaine transport system ATPase subunit